MRLSLTPSGYQNFLLNFSLELGPLLTSPKPPHHRSWPRSRTLRAAIFLNLSRWGRRPRWPCPQARDADLEPATLSSSLSPWWCTPRAIPKPAMSMTHSIPRPTALSSSPSLRRPELMMPSNPRYPWAQNAVVLPKPTRLHCIFSLSFWAYKSWFWYATLSHLFDMLHWFCSAALLWCAILSHCFDMLHCFWYAAFLWYATLPHCSMTKVSQVRWVWQHGQTLLYY
jgi:hypothetical protein